MRSFIQRVSLKCSQDYENAVDCSSLEADGGNRLCDSQDSVMSTVLSVPRKCSSRMMVPMTGHFLINQCNLSHPTKVSLADSQNLNCRHVTTVEATKRQHSLLFAFLLFL